MSAQPVVNSNPAAGSNRDEPRGLRRLRLVPPSRGRLARLPFAFLVVGILVVGMIGLLLLNTQLQGQAFEASQLKRQAAELSYTEGELRQQLVETSSTRELTLRATTLGLRPNQGVAYINLANGEVLGKPVAQWGEYTPYVLSRSDAEIARSRVEAAVNDRRKGELKVLNGHRQKILDERAAAEKAAREQEKRQQAERERQERERLEQEAAAAAEAEAPAETAPAAETGPTTETAPAGDDVSGQGGQG